MSNNSFELDIVEELDDDRRQRFYGSFLSLECILLAYLAGDIHRMGSGMDTDEDLERIETDVITAEINQVAMRKTSADWAAKISEITGIETVEDALQYPLLLIMEDSRRIDVFKQSDFTGSNGTVETSRVNFNQAIRDTIESFSWRVDDGGPFRVCLISNRLNL